MTKIYPIAGNNGELVAIELHHSFVSSRSIARFIERCEGCHVVSVRRLFSRSPVHVRFRFNENEYEVEEPFGDNSRLLITPSRFSQSVNDDLQSIAEVLRQTPRLRIPFLKAK